MRLTNEMRNDFADAVMAKVKMKSKWDQGKIEAEITKRLLAAQPAEVRAFAKAWPQQVNMVSIDVDFMQFRGTEGRYNWPKSQTIYGINLKDIVVSDLEQHWSDYRAELSERAAARARIMDTCSGVTTTQALAIVFPKLTKLIPVDQGVVKQLPVAATGLTDDLISMGLEIK